jgi:hypothetical protein
MRSSTHAVTWDAPAPCGADPRSLIGGTSGCSTHAEKIINCSVSAVHQAHLRICISTCHFGTVIHAIVVAGSRCIDSGPV